MDSNYFPKSNIPGEDNIEIKRYISMFISNWYWFLITLFISITLAYSINRYSEKVYSVSSSLLIKDDQLGSLNNNAASVIPGGDIFKSQQNLKNEMGILKSFSLNYKVMKTLKDFHVIYTNVGRRGIVESKMYNTCPFKVLYDSLALEPKGRNINIRILSEKEYILGLNGDIDFDTTMNFGDRFSKYGFDFTIVSRNPQDSVFGAESSNNYYFSFADPGSLASEYMNKLSATPIEKDASLVTLYVSGPITEQEADYLNALMGTYIQWGLDNKNETADNTIKFISKQLRKISDSLSLAEKNLENFRSRNSFINLSQEGLLIQNKLEKYENEKAVFSLQLQYYNYLWEYLNDKNATSIIISPSVIGIADQVLIKLVNDLSSLQVEKEKLSFNINLDQPAAALIYKQRDEARESLKENVRNGISNLKLSISESDRKISAVENEIGKLPSMERDLINIQRKFDLNNTVYTYLLEKRSESDIAKASNVPDNRIIDRATQFSSVQVKPKTRMNLIIALMMGFIIPIIAISLIDFFNDRVMDKSDIEGKTKVPVIGYISHNDGRSEIAVIEKPGSALSESFRAVRTALKYYVKGNDVSVIAVTSTISSEGKTFISINLAAITALLGKKVLLIGLDLRKPRINKVFEYVDSPGISTFLSENCSYEEIIKETQIKNLYYAPSGPIPPNPAELIETDQMKKFIDRAKKEFDFIIIDTPPVAIVTDTMLIATYVDINLFIVRQRFTSRSTVEMIEQLRERGELKNIAIVINDISLSGYYGYGMRYGYYHGYGYSYGYNFYGSNYYGKYGKAEKGYYTEE
jgi:capsular exopolysaccharide synthesis family protein